MLMKTTSLRQGQAREGLSDDADHTDGPYFNSRQRMLQFSPQLTNRSEPHGVIGRNCLSNPPRLLDRVFASTSPLHRVPDARFSPGQLI